MPLPTAQELFDAGVHIGHQVRRWNPRFRKYLYAHRHGISIIDLEKTLAQLERACDYAEHLVAGGQSIWLIGTKPQAKDIVREAAAETGMPFSVVRWLGGTLTNFNTIYQGLEKYRRFLEMEQSGEIEKMPNKEGAALRRKMQRMKANFEGLTAIGEPPAALFVVDLGNEDIAAREAKRTGVPVIAIVDSNSNPDCADFPIPGNDDSVRSIKAIVDAMVAAILRGVEARELSRANKLPPMAIGAQQDLEAEKSSVTLSEQAQRAFAEMDDGVDSAKEKEEV
ncbi:MAG: 30S ribosomal protein S2 [Puniceicoccales bacterium]|jgi:small subunit ribosomal protein S2|nr:30S ribosomal protein S2 [Puniceicoccales bacterium]